MIRALAAITGMIGLCLMLYGLGAQGGGSPRFMPAPTPPKPQFVMPAPLVDMIEAVQLIESSVR